MRDVEGEKNDERHTSISSDKVQDLFIYLLLGAMQVDDSPGFVQLGSHERPFFNTAGLDVLTYKWKRLVSLWGLEFNLRLHLAHIHQLSGHETVRTFRPAVARRRGPLRQPPQGR